MAKVYYYLLFPSIHANRRHLVALLYMALLMVAPMYLGAFTEVGDNHELYVRMRNAAIGMPLFTAYIWLAHTSIYFSVKSAIEKFTLALDDDNEFDKHEAIAKLTRTSIRNLKFALLLGIITTGAYNSYENLMPNSSYRSLMMYLIISAIPFWIAAWFIVLQLYTITHHIINEIIKRQTLDLFGLKTLLPLSDQFISFIIVAAVLFALSPVFWIGKQVPLADIVLLGTAFLFLCAFFFGPILNIQNRMYHKKKLAVKRINLSIQNLLNNRKKGNRRLTDDPERLRELSALISAKSEIKGTSEWAISLPQQIRGIIVVFSIPLSWVAASMIETGISKMTLF
jgi:hypothetical protein